MNGKNGHNVLQHAMEGLGLELAESKLLQHMEEQNVMGISKKRKLVTINLAQVQGNHNYVLMHLTRNSYCCIKMYSFLYSSYFTVPCKWEDWGEWDTCSQTCGGGMHARVRNVATYAQFGGDPCPGEAAEMGPCNEQPCPSK